MSKTYFTLISYRSRNTECLKSFSDSCCCISCSSAAFFDCDSCTYDVRDLLNAAVQLRDGKPLSDLKMNWIKKFALGKAVEKVQDTDLGRLLLEYKII